MDNVPIGGFAAIGRTGDSGVWRYVFGLGAIALAGALGIIIAATAFAVIGAVDAPADFPFRVELDARAQAVATFAFLMLSIAPALVCALWWVARVHHRPVRSLLTARARFDWAGAAISFGLMLALYLAGLGLALWLEPTALSADFQPGLFLLFVPVVLVTLPIQVLAEEVVFRGYLLQFAGRLSRNAAFQIGLVSAVFFALHLGNAEARAGPGWGIAAYAILSVYFTFLAHRGGGLELSIGAHGAQNIYATMIVAAEPSSVDTPALFHAAGAIDQSAVVFMAACFALHYWLLRRLLPRLRETGRVAAEPSAAD